MKYKTDCNAQVVVENIGTIYNGNRELDARQDFNTYKKFSQSKYGACAGYTVTLIIDGEIVREHIGRNSKS